MPTDAQLLIGKVLQIKDKITAKRHCIPRELKTEWLTLNKKTACFDSAALYKTAVKGDEGNKHLAFSGSVKELSSLVNRLNALNEQVNSNAIRH